MSKETCLEELRQRREDFSGLANHAELLSKIGLESEKSGWTVTAHVQRARAVAFDTAMRIVEKEIQ